MTNSVASLALNSVGLRILSSSQTLNNLVNFVTGGRVNKESLATTLLDAGLNFASNFAINRKLLGERSATLVPLARQAVIDNDLSQMRSAIRSMADDILKVEMKNIMGAVSSKAGELLQHTATSITGLKDVGYVVGKASDYLSGPVISALNQPLAAVAGFAAGHASAFAGEAILGDRAVERIITRHIDKHGTQPLKNYITDMVKACLPDWLKDTSIGRWVESFFSGVGEDVFKEKLYKQEFSGVEHHTADVAADFVQHVLSGRKISVEEVKSSLVGQLVRTQRDAIDAVVARIPYMEPKFNDFADAYQQRISSRAGNGLGSEGLVDWALNTRASARDIAEAILMERAIDDQNGDAVRDVQSILDDIERAYTEGHLSSEQRLKFQDVAKILDPERLTPLGLNNRLEVSHTATGQLAAVRSTSTGISSLSKAKNDAFASRMETRNDPGTALVNGGFKVDKSYASHCDRLDIVIQDAGRLARATDAAKAWGSSALSYAASWLGGSTDASLKISEAGEQQIRSLYLTCGQNEGVLEAVTKMLDPDHCRKILLETTKEAVGLGDDLLYVGQSVIKVSETDDPRIKYLVTTQPDLSVCVEIVAEWDVASYGLNPQRLVEPKGGEPSVVTSRARMTFSPGDPVSVQTEHLGIECTIHNRVRFAADGGDHHVD